MTPPSCCVAFLATFFFPIARLLIAGAEGPSLRFSVRPSFPEDVFSLDWASRGLKLVPGDVYLPFLLVYSC